MYTLLIILLITVGVVIPPALLYLIYKPPTSLIQYFQLRWPDILWLGPIPSTSTSTSTISNSNSNSNSNTASRDKLIALTIDDGPSPYIAEILQILKANDATATFFLIGSNITDSITGAETNTSKAKAAETPQTQTETLHNLLRAGNELANHAMRDEPSWRLSDAELIAQIKTVERKIQHIYNSVYTTTTTTSTPKNPPENAPQPQPSPPPKPPKYFRPGSGFFTTRMRHLLAALGYKLVLGSVYPHDAQIPFPRVNAWHVLDLARPGGIIICHDGRRWTAPMLRVVLPELGRRGYRVVTVTELVGG
ncbi:polysaccharide deacetylase [Blastomyces gilchristii SLH14081]|uniref:chitin deacetylase n=1 Tax=Blastomyces gilchristii (strain SLH14081) TaxID=559298 RepID=A0A179UMJ6_BLAGS|nr:polysaccharide deacetylase [Blastomyces gilchristii SLH14081]OAT09194.1 polysaccharide deacetylase [Blastomyces gilchristii SLH14081]